MYSTLNRCFLFLVNVLQLPTWQEVKKQRHLGTSTYEHLLNTWSCHRPPFHWFSITLHRQSLSPRRHATACSRRRRVSITGQTTSPVRYAKAAPCPLVFLRPI